MKINHHVTFSGPGYVPTSTDETSARETTTSAPADVGIDPYAISTSDALDVVDPNNIDDHLQHLHEGQ